MYGEKMRKTILWIFIFALFISFTACVDGDKDFNEPNVKRLKSEYKMYNFPAYNMVLGMSKDASTFVALMDETKEDGQKKLVFIDSETALEKGRLTIDPRWQMMQKRARWSEDGSCFVLSDAWNSSVESRSANQVPGYVIYPEKMVMSSFGELPLEEEGNVACSPAFDSTGENVTFSVYNSETDHTTHYIRNGQGPEDDMIFQTQTKGIASILMLSEGKYLESVESPTDGTDTILFINGEVKQTVAHVKDAFRSIYIKDYSENRRRVLIFETSLVTEGTQIAMEKIIPKIAEFDSDFEDFELKEIRLPKKYDVLNGILSPGGRYIFFIVYSGQDFVLVLYDIQTSKTVELINNKELGSTFIGTLPGRVDGLFVSDDLKILLTADNGVFLFRLE